MKDCTLKIKQTFELPDKLLKVRTAKKTCKNDKTKTFRLLALIFI